MFSCETCKILKITYFEYLRATASGVLRNFSEQLFHITLAHTAASLAQSIWENSVENQ